ncbi:MAG: hypothetical protein KAU06_03305 [Candidatus Marinimicrobia bacterium]|nr:hypothetical protein [Candidatus Neomarinimicrobiota bacterium]
MDNRAFNGYEAEKKRFNEDHHLHLDSLREYAQEIDGDVKIVDGNLEFDGIFLLKGLSIKFTYDTYRSANSAIQGLGWFKELIDKLPLADKLPKVESQGLQWFDELNEVISREMEADPTKIPVVPALKEIIIGKDLEESDA